MVKNTSNYITYTAGTVVAILGALCMLSWLTGHYTIIQLSPDFLPMSFNTALCHFLCGCALIACLQHKYSSLAFAFTAGLFALAIGWQYVSHTETGIDDYFVTYDLPSGSPHPGRMAPNTVLYFFVFATSIICWNLIKDRKRRLTALMLLGLLAVLLSLAVLMGYLLEIESLYKWGGMNMMAPLTATAFMTLSVGLISLIYTDREGLEKRLAVIAPLLVTAVGLTVSLLCVQAFIIEDSTAGTTDLNIGLTVTLFVTGVILPFLAGSALWQREKIKVYSRELETKEQRYRRTVNAAQVGLWDWDLRTKTLVWGGSSYEIMGTLDNASLPVREEDVMGLISENDRKEVQREVLASIERTEGFIADYRTRCLDGREIWVQSRGKVVEFENGHPAMISGTLMDITEGKTKEHELMRSNQELEQFAYIASHDLKAPLRGIDNLAKWVIEDTGDMLPEGAREKLDMLRGRVMRLESLLEDILTYSRAGRISDDPQNVDVGALITEMQQSYLPDTFKLVVKGSLPSVYSPRTPLVQIFGNIFSNAVKHHDKVQGTVTVESRDAGSFYWFLVTDDGPGIPYEYHTRAFQMFQTLKPRDQVDGSGIGMAIIKKLVEWRGGSCWITDGADGRGACINFLWPKTWA